MSVRWIWAPEAQDDLRAIWYFVATQYSTEKADRLMSQFIEGFYGLADRPGKGRRRPEWSRKETVRFWPIGDYWVVYYPETVPLEILHVIHMSRDVPRHL